MCSEERSSTSTLMVEKCLLKVIYQKPLVAAPKRLQRMLLHLQKYVGYISNQAQHMHLADTLSRAPLSRDNEVLSIEKQIGEIRMVNFAPIHSASLENIRQESLKDNSIQTLQKVIKNGWPETKADLPVQVTPYFDVRDQLSVESLARSPCQTTPSAHLRRRLFETCQRKGLLARNDSSPKKLCQLV